MIRINLIPQKRAKRRRGAREPGARELWIGVVCLVGAFALVFVAVDMPRRAELGRLHTAISKLDGEIAAKHKKLVDYPKLKKESDDAKARAKSINRLLRAVTIPANVLHELGEILTPNQLPTMTEQMKDATGPNGDPNKMFDVTWDPTHIWLTSYVDKKGAFTIEGGAKAESDITQFSKRLAASAYFSDVAQSRDDRTFDKASGITYYTFTITGKVAY